MATIVTFEVELSGFELTIAGLDAAPDELEKALRDAMNDAVHIVHMAAEEKVPRRTGRLAASIGSRPTPRFGAELIGSVGVSMEPPPYGDAFEFAPYAKAVEEGASAHVIRARGRARGGKKALWWKGARHPVHSVHHPGMKAQPFLRPALDDNHHRIRSAFSDAMQRVLNRIGRGGL